MTNDAYAEKVLSMTQSQLLAEVMENPEYLTDPYYAVLGRAIRRRYEQLEPTQ